MRRLSCPPRLLRTRLRWVTCPLGVFVLLTALTAARPAQAQGSCGAAGGSPSGPAFSVCDFAREAAGLPPDGPALGAGNPIDLATGNKYRHDTDFRLQAWVPVVFARHYNSINRQAGAMGVGWSHSFETRLVPVRTGHRAEVQIIQGDGRRRVFDADPSIAGRFRTASIAQGVIDRHAARSGDAAHWTWRWPGGRSLRFDHHGRLHSIWRDGQQVLSLRYDPRGRLAEVSGPGDGELRFEYEDGPFGSRLASLQGARSTLARYTYDATGQLSTVTWPDGRGQRFEYEDPHDPLRLTRVLAIDPHAHLTQSTQVRELARYAYDAQGRAIRSTDGDETVEVAYLTRQRGRQPGLTAVTDAHGQRAQYRWTYDRHRHIARLVQADGSACASCPPTDRRYTWNANGLLVRIQHTRIGEARTLELDYDPIGRPRSAWLTHRWRGATAQAGRQLQWRVAYDGTDPLAWPTRIDQPSVAPGQVHRLTVKLDERGRPVSLTEHGFSPVPGSSIYQPIRREFSLTHREASESSSAADWLVGLSQVDGPLPGHDDRIDIDQREGLLQLKYPQGIEETLWLREGLLQEHWPAIGDRVRMQRNQPQTQWLGGPTLTMAFATAYSLGSSGPSQIRFHHEPFGRLLSMSLRDGEQYPVRRLANAPPAANDSQPQAHRALDFWRGHPTAIALPDGSVFKRGFDDFGRVVWIDEPGRPRQWAEYDEADRLVVHHTGDGSILRHSRDSAGRLISSHRHSHSGATLLGRYRWQGMRLVQAGNDTVDIQYEWDAIGRLVATVHRFAHRPHASLRHEWHYDLASRVTREALADGTQVHYRHEGHEIIGIRIEPRGAAPVSIDVAALQAPLQLHAFDPEPRDPGTVRYEAGRLVEAGGVRHLVDPHGRRATKAVMQQASGGHLAFIHQDWRLRTELPEDAPIRQWIWAGPRPVARIESGRVVTLITDARGAPVRALDSRGETVWRARYNARGAALVDPASTLDVPLRLPGQYADAETGWHHNHWRTYSPFTGRYLEADPLGLQADFIGRASLTDYAGGDPIGSTDPWGLARLSWFALTQDAQGKSMGQTQGFDRARWSFMIEDILPVPLTGSGAYAPATAGIQGLLFDPWGDFMRGTDSTAPVSGNAVDTLSWNGASGRQVFASFAAHYGGALVSPQRFVVDAFDDRRAGALALILAASPSQRQACVGRALGSLPALSLGPAEPLLRPAQTDPGGASRILNCSRDSSLPVSYRDDLERSRIERYQAAAELQESPSAAINENCALSTGCRTRARIEVNGRSYWASYGRTQFTVTTFLGELSRLSQPSMGAEAAGLRAALRLDSKINLNGQPASLGDALELTRRRVESAYRSFASLRTEFGRGLSADQASRIWASLSAARRDAFSSATGLGQEGFIDMLGYVATGIGGRTEEEGRHALAASAAATVRYTETDGAPGAVQTFEQWLIALYSSRDPYDHVSRTFLRDNLRRVMSAPQLAGRWDNTEAPDSAAWHTRQMAIERDLAQRVAVLHNAGRLDLATSTQLSGWLASNPQNWISGYVSQFTTADNRGNWEALRCASGLAQRGGLQMTTLVAMPDPLPGAPGSVRRSLLR